MAISLAQIAEAIGGNVHGDQDVLISGLATLNNAGPTQLSFLANPKYAAQLEHTRAAAVIIASSVLDRVPCNAIVVDQPYLAFARATKLFDNAPIADQKIHPSAIISSSAKIASRVTIGPNAVVGDDVVIGEGSWIGANVVISDYAVIGADCHIMPNVSIYHHVKLGDRVRIQSGATIGSDGFGFAPTKVGWLRINQLGSVSIGDDVDIGANTTIDRGALDDTVIENNVIIDNLVQIAHNVVIGEGSAIAGCTGIAGSSVIGKRCTLAGGVGVVGHISICDDVHVTGMTMVTRSITQPGSYSSGTPMSDTKTWKRNAVRFNQLNDFFKKK